MSDNRAIDRRIARTKLAIRTALVALIEEKGFEELTVIDVADQADINRGTFYLHYTDKFDLLDQTVDDVIGDLKTIFGQAKTLRLADLAKPDEPWPLVVEIYEYVQANLALLEAQLARAQSDAETLKANSGLDPDTLRLAQDRVVNAQDAVVAAQNRVAAQMKSDSVALKAPFAGTVSVHNLKVGESVSAGQPMVTLVNFSQWEVKTDDLTEIEVVKIKDGQNVTVKLDALPDVTLTGVVTAISSQYEEKRGDITYTVTIGLTSADPRMRWGMTAYVNFAN